jgi:hypothetical protein
MTQINTNTTAEVETKKGRASKAKSNKGTAKAKADTAPKATKEKKISKVELMVNWIRKNSGKYTKKEIVEKLGLELGIVPGTAGTIFSYCQNEKFHPEFWKATGEEMVTTDDKKVVIRKKK